MLVTPIRMMAPLLRLRRSVYTTSETGHAAMYTTKSQTPSDSSQHIIMCRAHLPCALTAQRK